MSKLKFYGIEKAYLNFLKQHDPKVPNQDYKTNDKFFCGVVLEIDGFKYFVPVSHYNKQDNTNFVIKNNKGQAISSLRFCFMIPVPEQYITYKDFSKETDKKYVKLLDTEIEYCRQNQEEISKKALKVYKIGCNSRHPLNRYCCDFKKLEEVQAMYNK
ncbi:type III toxin-antitoxin system ToxN/AbiQ family toxin [Clostridium perfringens]|nr:type III toxin-antitoxin system ToxN/AbiQ family toxin [Clostridium perfringens]